MGNTIRRLTRITMAAAVLVAAAAIDRQAEAQSSSGRRGMARASANDRRMLGWVLGVHTVAAPGVSVSGEDIEIPFTTAFGSGLGAMVGYGFSPMLTGFVALDFAKQQVSSEDLQGNLGLVHLEIGARLNLRMGNEKTTPYATAAIGRRGLSAQVTHDEFDEPHPFSLSGTVLTLGGGVQHFLSPKTALDAGLTLGFGSFSQVDDAGERYTLEVNSSTSVRFKVGLTWRP